MYHKESGTLFVGSPRAWCILASCFSNCACSMLTAGFGPLAGQKEAERTALCCGAKRHKLGVLGNN